MAAVAFIAGVLVGCVVIGLVLRARLTGLESDLAHGEREAARLSSERAEAGTRVVELEGALSEARAGLGGEVIELRMQLAQERKAADEKIRLLEDAERRLTTEFKSLSAEALRMGSEQLVALAKSEAPWMIVGDSGVRTGSGFGA